MNHARPSVDVLFESVADAFGPRVLGLILTGLNGDGASGCARIKRRGGLVVVEDPRTAESAQMPNAAIAATKGAKILSLDGLPGYLTELCGTPPCPAGCWAAWPPACGRLASGACAAGPSRAPWSGCW